MLRKFLSLPIVVSAVFLCAANGGAASALEKEKASEVMRIRPTVSRLREAVETGMARSATFRELVDRLEESDVIVHIAPQLRPREAIGGELQFAVASGGARYLRITVRPDLRTSQLVAMIGHELQHALEVARHAAVVDGESLAVLYRSIGYQNGSGCHETDAARSVELRVLREVDR